MAMLALAWTALSLAAAGPATEASSSSSAKAGLDIVFTIDASPSMAAKDLEPTRLDAAKELVRSFIGAPDGAAGAAVGLVAFGADAALACPPTTDYVVVLERLDAIRPGILGDGTALGLGLASALRQLAASGAARGALVLLSDGEDNVGLVHPVDAAAAAGRSGARLIVVGLGSRGDIPIDYVDPVTGQRMSGTYRSGFDEATMESIARAGGGEYRSVADSGALASLLADLGAIETAPAGTAALYATGARQPVGRPLFVLAMVLAAAAWSVRRLAFGGLA
jgi:Ca-activated chloride channel family protein